jgi:hypothetical protein|tara:strand:- start:7525 stop:7758 length:234 start_codon:yes stop_codon:yes gene_type:complete
MKRKFNEGDLVHIPQDVQMYREFGPLPKKTDKPILGVVIKDSLDYPCEMDIFVEGERFKVSRKSVYPMEEMDANQTY